MLTPCTWWIPPGPNPSPSPSRHSHLYECTLDDVDHAPSCQVARAYMEYSQEQMRAAVEFYDRSGLSLSAAATATNGEAAGDSYDCKREGVAAGGYHRHYADARDAGVRAGAVLLSCTDGNGVDAVALAVLLLTRHHSRPHSHSTTPGAMAAATCTRRVGSELMPTTPLGRMRTRHQLCDILQASPECTPY
jgi:hypothetical protein